MIHLRGQPYRKIQRPVRLIVAIMLRLTDFIVAVRSSTQQTTKSSRTSIRLDEVAFVFSETGSPMDRYQPRN